MLCSNDDILPLEFLPRRSGVDGGDDLGEEGGDTVAMGAGTASRAIC